MECGAAGSGRESSLLRLVLTPLALTLVASVSLARSLYVVLSLLSLSRRRLALNRKAAFASVDTSAPGRSRLPPHHCLRSLTRSTRPRSSPADLKKASDTLSLLTTVDLAYLPLTVHWWVPILPLPLPCPPTLFPSVSRSRAFPLLPLPSRSLSAGAWSSSVRLTLLPLLPPSSFCSLSFPSPSTLVASQFPTGVFGTIAALAQLKLGWEGSRPAAVNSTPVSPPAEEEKVSWARRSWGAGTWERR